MSETSSPRVYGPGELAPFSGVYRVSHLTGHRPTHDAVIIRGEELPACRTCGGKVRFVVVDSLSHVTHEWDFAGPHGLLVSICRRDVRDLRRSRRYEVDLPVTIQLQARGDLKAVDGCTSNISEGGMNATFDTLVSSIEPMEIAITVPDENGALFASARLRHVNGQKHGFEFVRLDRRAKRKLQLTLRWLRR
ncbi:MAG TPA: PilZ domain-containing protein [Terriglobales bacterium]|nr:PilZ domain-containing protein [Terriglobales bacterium]